MPLYGIGSELLDGPSDYNYLCLPIFLSVCLSFCLSVCLSIRLSVGLPHVNVYMSTHARTRLSVCLRLPHVNVYMSKHAHTHLHLFIGQDAS